MTKTITKPVKFVQEFKTKSGIPITIGTGSGTKWQWKKKSRPAEEQHTLTDELVDQLGLALKNGYNHIDTAEIYTTHPEVAEAVKQSGKAREDLWITTKYNPGFRTVKAPSKGPAESLDKALAELKTSYVDLFLIHSPFLSPENSSGQTIETAWQELIDAKKAGKVRFIGVSNFAVPHLERTFKVAESADFYPVVNQIEFHPYLQNQSKNIISFCQENNILVEAYGPLTPLFRINKENEEITEHPLTKLVPKLSEKYDKTDAQILLRYTYQKGILPITTSSKEERIKESLEIVNFELDEEDFKAIEEEGASFSFRGFFAEEFEGLE